MVLVDFLQSGVDNVPLNRTLEFVFSSPIDPNSVSPASIQIRQGPSFGSAIAGSYVVQANRVFFEPRLAGRCDLTDGGLQPDTDYRVTLIGSPEEFALRSLTQFPLQSTVNAEFHTRLDTDPALFEDQIPGALPTVLSVSPANSEANVLVGPSNKCVIQFSENVDPCTINENTVLLYQYATGPFAANDATPGDPFTWGTGNPTSPPRRVRATFSLVQTKLATTLTLTPIFGEWADNALITVSLTNSIRDYGGNPLVPYAAGWTTEDRPPQTRSLTWEFNGDVPIDQNLSTGEVNTARALSKAQGFLLVSGDGDNGPAPGNPLLVSASGPDNSRGAEIGANPCVAPFGAVANDGVPDDFDPPTDAVLNTGTINTCKNGDDGSAAVTFEFRSFRIRSGVTVRLTGVNPAIILVRGDIRIEGRLLARSDGVATTSSVGGNGINNSYTTKTPGGVGVAGGGNGGQAENTGNNVAIYSQNGAPGYGSSDWKYPQLAPGDGGAVSATLQGPGRGAVGTFYTNQQSPVNRISPSGGGAGHTATGTAGVANGSGTVNRQLMNNFTDGAAGGSYGDITSKMAKPEAGSGGGGGGTATSSPFGTNSTFVQATGGGGGAGGGFVDLTTQADIYVSGTIDAAGGRGGNGSAVGANGVQFGGGGGGGGGGSGGGIRLLTPGRIVVGAGAVITVAGGSGGTSPAYAPYAPANPGGNGSVGRLVLEDGDNFIEGLGGGVVTPAPGQPGFYASSQFDATRFQGGGLRPVVISTTMDMGPAAPVYLVPSQIYNMPPVPAPGTPRQDFIAGVPPTASRLPGGITSMFVELQGFPANSDGTINTLAGTGWKSVGWFQDSGAESFPTWNPSAKPPAGDIAALGGILPGNTGDGITQLNTTSAAPPNTGPQTQGMQFVQMRITFYLPSTIGPFDPGPYIDRWTLNFQYDQ
ncbi:MAG: Ig-like domain-containing protein [Planctomycetes bacterium]|nr:Ig-like domain-containing protein [Planctomycetota bacterium]